MTKSLDQLLHYLLDEIAASGPAGVSIPQLLGLVKTFYEGDQCVDNTLLAQVWKWLGRHPDISIGAAKKFNQTPLEEFQVDPTDPLTAWKSRSPKVQASEDLIYRSICGHSRQEAQIFPPEHALLMQIAASRANGIMQGDLGRQTGQDKRSVPKRTDVLHNKGYIVKHPIMSKGTKTSLLILRRYAHLLAANAALGTTTTTAATTTTQLLVRDVIRRLDERLSDDSPVELTKLVDVTGDEGEAAKKVLSRIIRALEKIGCLKRVKAAFGPSAHASDLKTVVQQIRPLSDEDLVDLQKGPLTLARPVTDLLNEEKNKSLDQSPRMFPPWNPDRLVVNQLQDLMRHMAPGLEADSRTALLGPFVQTAVFPTAPSPSPLSGSNSSQTMTSSYPATDLLPSTALHSRLLAEQIQGVHAADLLPSPEEPQIVTGTDGLDVVKPIAKANPPDPDSADGPRRRRRRKSQKGEEKDRNRIADNRSDEEMRPQGRPRRFVRGTEKFWQHHFWQAKLAKVADQDVPVTKGGIMHDPAGLELFESRPPDFDETLVQATAAGLPIPATPDAINADWVLKTRNVIGRAESGVYITPAGMYLGRARHRSQLLIVRSSRLNLINWRDESQIPAFRFIPSMASHSFSRTSYHSPVEQVDTKPPPRTARKLKRKRQKMEDPIGEASPETVTRKRRKPQPVSGPDTAVSPRIEGETPALDGLVNDRPYTGATKSDAEPECTPQQADTLDSSTQISARMSKRQNAATTTLSPSSGMPAGELDGNESTKAIDANIEEGDRLVKTSPRQHESYSDDVPALPTADVATPMSFADGTQRDDRSPVRAQDGPSHDTREIQREQSPEYQPSLGQMDASSVLDGRKAESHDGFPEQPAVGEHSDLSESEKLMLRTRQGRGGDSAICQEILFELVELVRGAAPYNRTTLQNCMVARWQAKGGKGYRPLMKAIKSAATRLVETERVREHTFSFRGKGGAMIRRSILHFPSVQVTSAQIAELKQRIMVADTTEYIPQEWAAEMLPPGHLVDRKSRARKNSTSERPEGGPHDDKSKSASKRRKGRHASLPGTREATPVSECMPVCTPATGFLTLKVASLGSLPQVQEYNAKLQERLSKEAAAAASRPVQRANGRTVAWARPHASLPGSLDDLLDMESQDRGNTESADSFVRQIDTVAKWEQREAQLLIDENVAWTFFNHVTSVGAPCSTLPVRWFLVQFEMGTEASTERECVEFPSWSVFQDVQQLRASVDDNTARESAAHGRRLTRQSTGALKKTKWTGIDDYVEEDKASERSRGKKRRRRRTTAAATLTDNLSQDSEWEDEDDFTRESVRARKKARMMASSSAAAAAAAITTNSTRPQPRLEGKDLTFALGVVCIRSLVGGIEQTVDWDIVREVCPDLDGKAARDRWKALLSKHREEIDNLVQQFQDKYVAAFEQGDAPAVDFEKLGQTEWHGIVTWAEGNLTPLRAQAVAEPKLAGSRREVLAEHDLELERPRSLDVVYEHSMALNNSAKTQLYSAIIESMPSADMLGVVVPNGSGSLEAQLATARSYVLATVMTPDSMFDAGRAEAKLLSLASTSEESKSLLLRAVNSLHAEKKIVKHASYVSEPLGLRQWKLSSLFGDAMESRRLVNKWLVRAAANYKTHVLDASFAAGDGVTVPKEGIVDDGIMLAIVNLISSAQIAIRPGRDVPQSRYGIDWETAGYQTRLIERNKACFTTTLRPTKLYSYGDPVQSSRLTRVPRRGAPRSPIPLWIDINGNVLAEWWETAVAVVLGLLHARPGLSADACARMLNGTMSGGDVDLVLEWSKQSGVARQRPGAGHGWEATAWWWLALGEGIDWT